MANHRIRTTFIIIRHGQTDWNLENRFQGHIDVPLNETGREQANAVAARLADEAIDAIYCSDLSRARETASVLAGHHELQENPDARLRERNMGIFQGLTFAEIAAQHPEEYEKFLAWSPEYRMPDGETGHEKNKRVIEALHEIADAHPHQQVAVVTHGGVLDGIFRHTLNLNSGEPRRYKNFNASINRFYRTADGWLLGTWGEVSHLKGTQPNALAI